MLTGRALGRATAVTIVAAAVTFAPLAAYADPISPGTVGDTVGVGTIDVGSVTSNNATCRLDSQELFASPLTATVENKAGGEVDFVWHAAAHAAVSSADPCVTGIMVTTQLTDTTTVPNCPPVVQSPAAATASDDPFTYYSNGRTDYEADNPLAFGVAYFGGPATADPAAGAAGNQIDTSGASASQVGSAALTCARLRSTVTESDTAYYRNSQHQYVPFCTERVSSDYVSTPSGPRQVGDSVLLSTIC
jgi:hypothetical protein